MIAAAAWQRQIEIRGRLDSIGETVGEFELVIPHRLARKRAGRGSIAALAVAVGHHRVVGFEFNDSPPFGRIGINFELPRIDLGGRAIGEQDNGKSQE